MAAPIRPKDLPSGSPTDTASIPFDTGTVVQRATPSAIVNAATPIASQAEAEAGINNVNRMTALRTKQANQAQVLTPLATASGGSGADLVATIQAGTGAIARTMLAKSREVASIDDFGGVDASAKLTAALTAKRNITLAAGSSYTLGSITLSNTESIDFQNASITAKAASTNIFTLTNYNARLSNAYIASGVSASDAVIRLTESRYSILENVIAVNCGPGFINLTPVDPVTGFIALPILSNIDAEDIANVGIRIGSSVSEIRASNIHLHGKLVYTGPLAKPTAGSIGWLQDTPLSTFATGGHQAVNLNMICFEKGFVLEDALLTKISNSIADSTSDYGVDIGGVSNFIELADLFVGTTRGLRVRDSARVIINGVNSILNGVIPAWATPDFFNGVTTFYDYEVRDTAKLLVRALAGDCRIAVDAGARLILDSGQCIQRNSQGNIAAGATQYLGEAGATSTRVNAQWRASYDCYLVRLSAYCTNAPGSGQTYTYYATVNQDTGRRLTGTSSGASAFSTGDIWAGSHIAVSRGEVVDLTVVTSATASAGQHWAEFQVVPRQ